MVITNAERAGKQTLAVCRPQLPLHSARHTSVGLTDSFLSEDPAPAATPRHATPRHAMPTPQADVRTLNHLWTATHALLPLAPTVAAHLSGTLVSAAGGPDSLSAFARRQHCAHCGAVGAPTPWSTPASASVTGSRAGAGADAGAGSGKGKDAGLSLIHISEPTRPY